MSLSAVHNHRQSIVDEISKSIDQALSNRSAGEPQLVANLVFYLTKTFNSSISLIFSKEGIKISSGGIFVHQTPKVTFRNLNNKGIELGDLLLVATHKINGKSSRNAILLQAKKFNNLSGFPKPDNPKQHYLYSHWPEFEYMYGYFRGQKRKITPPNNDGAMYLLIGEHQGNCGICGPSHMSWVVYTAYPTQPVLSRRYCLVEELYKLIFLNSGRPFTYPSSNGNWDNVMTDLIDVTAHIKNVKVIMNAGDPSGSRGQGTFLIIDKSSLLYQNLGNKGSRNFSGDAEYEGEGISIIEFNIEYND